VYKFIFIHPDACACVRVTGCVLPCASGPDVSKASDALCGLRRALKQRDFNDVAEVFVYLERECSPRYGLCAAAGSHQGVASNGI
jgi:hypothetical protein